ncbi:WD repeat domain-containing protein [Tetrabaena socialis]|uniref:WD repeat domain-containing protein n=1 Tax=Tetrabaena socialis TaxID=47790 RepID=A0A2J8AJM8_9CHLO|nr:WD repeat domain-containing protein [Tetrabaena socialis]|eukprot:PNH12718.1 WD repeat domain-containing protein [Tetrabaena socialis]
MGHIRFDDDADDEGMSGGAGAPPASTSYAAPAAAALPGPPSTSYAAPAAVALPGPPSILAAAAGGMRLPQCCGSARVDFNFSNPCYVFRVAPNQATGLVAASVSNHTIKLYQPSGPQLSLVGELRGHTGTITDLAFCGTSQPALVMSSSADGSVAAWDVRSGQQTERYQVRGQDVFSFSSLEHVLAAGTTGEVVFWDRRGGKQLAKLDDTHAEDVTQVRFHSSGQVLSGSTDGLIAVHDVSKSFNDDDVFQAAININNSVEEFGLYGADGGRLWVRTGTESMHLWEWLRATNEEVAGGDMQFAEFANARLTASQACAASAAAPMLPQVDYLVGCHYDSPTNQLFLLAGHNDGPIAFLPIVEQQGPQGAMAAAALACPVMALAGGHSSIVRSAQCLEGAGGNGPFCVTGGEDALVCLWTLDGGGAAAAAAADAPLPGPPPLRRVSPGPERQHQQQQEKQAGRNRRPSPY